MQMRRTHPDPLTKQRLLDAALELMQAKGYTATSVDEICERAGLTKGSFFHYFEGKEHLGKLLAERYYTSWQQFSRSAPFRQKKDPLDRVFGHVDLFIEASHCSTWKGCLLGTFVQELFETHPQICSVCAACLDDLVGTFQQDLEAAKAVYTPRARWSTESVAKHLLAVAQGAIILVKAKQDPKVFEESLGHFKKYLHCLFQQ
jgi:TetR/AcrR family transcriptional repressor of nem operon